jgi:protein PET117
MALIPIQTMYQGVLRDDERRREKMRQRQNDLLQSHQKREIYERVQTVNSEGDSREELA